MGLTGLRLSTGRKDLSKSSKRKIEKKLNFIATSRCGAKLSKSDVNIQGSSEEIAEAVTSLGAKKTIGKKKRLRSRQKKLKAYDLSALSDVLPDADALPKPSKPAKFKANCKNKQKLVQKESALLSSVHNHPVFQADPISTIQQYLERTQPPPSLPAVQNRSGMSKKENLKRSK